MLTQTEEMGGMWDVKREPVTSGASTEPHWALSRKPATVQGGICCRKGGWRTQEEAWIRIPLLPLADYPCIYWAVMCQAQGLHR